MCCSICGKEGHKANNKHFHPTGNPNAKIGVVRATVRSAVQRPPRNTGEIDDEDDSKEVDSGTEDEDSDDEAVYDASDMENDSQWGEASLRWEEDEHAHDPLPGDQNDESGPHLPRYHGQQPGIHLADALDMDSNDVKQAFALFWPPAVVEKMCQATSSFGRLYVKRWTKPITIDEFHAFLGLVIHLGLISYTGLRQKLWENSWKGNQFVRAVMTYNRFEMILRAWHYMDYGEYTAEEIKQNKKNDPFWPVAALEEALNVIFRNNLKPGQCIDIDEQCIPWKGRHKCRCYNKSKPVKRHFKVFSLNDSRSGYQLGYYLYRGKQENRPETVSASAFPAHKLLADEFYHDKNHVLFTDNWFTSFEQLEVCMRRGIHMVGTVRQKRKGIPFSFKTNHGQRQLRQRGDYTTVKSGYQVSEDIGDDVYYTAWLDRKPVGVLHTFPTALGTCFRMVKTKEDGWQRQQYDRPTIIPTYNWGMGGTDSGDQRMEAYRPELKTLSWIPRVLSHFLNGAVVNSFIWYNTAFPLRRKTHYAYREALVDRLVFDLLDKQRENTGRVNERSRTLKQWSKDQGRLLGQHWSIQERKPEELRVEGSNPSDPTNERSRNWFRGHCMICGRTVPTKCEQCRVYLCTDFRAETNSTCMKYFHMENQLQSKGYKARDQEN